MKKFVLLISITISVNALYGQKIDSTLGISFPGVLFDNPYANQKFIGTWVIKGWNGNKDLFESMIVVVPSLTDQSIDSSLNLSTPKFQDSLIILEISNHDYAKIISIPGCNCSFVSYYDMSNDILYADNPVDRNSNPLIISRNPNGDALNVKLGYYVNDTIYKEKSFVFEEMYKYTKGSMKLKLPKETKNLKLKDIDKLEFELRTGKVYGNSILPNTEYKILGYEIATQIDGNFEELNVNSLSDFKLKGKGLRVKKTFQKYWISLEVLTQNDNTETFYLSFNVNEKDEIILE
jgi:hypothetical protein